MKKLLLFLKTNNLTISSCESFTGGGFANQLTNFKGASCFFKGGFVCYSNDFKSDLLNINIEIIKKYDAVSKEVLIEMLKNTYNLLKTNIVVGFTGYAPPCRNNEGRGLSYLGFIYQEKYYIYKFKYFKNVSRKSYKKKAIKFIINKIINM